MKFYEPKSRTSKDVHVSKEDSDDDSDVSTDDGAPPDDNDNIDTSEDVPTKQDDGIVLYLHKLTPAQEGDDEDDPPVCPHHSNDSPPTSQFFQDLGLDNVDDESSEIIYFSRETYSSTSQPIQQPSLPISSGPNFFNRDEIALSPIHLNDEQDGQDFVDESSEIIYFSRETYNSTSQPIQQPSLPIASGPNFFNRDEIALSPIHLNDEQDGQDTEVQQ